MTQDDEQRALEASYLHYCATGRKVLNADWLACWESCLQSKASSEPQRQTPCTHDLAERETACADGYCPICLQNKYQELLYAVARKFPGESRHETALRYIRQAETSSNAQAAAPKPPETKP